MKILIVICNVLKILAITFMIFCLNNMKVIGFLMYCISTLIQEMVLIELSEKNKKE